MQVLLIVVLMLAFWPAINPPPSLPVKWTLANIAVGLLLARATAELPALYLAHQVRVQPERRWRWLWLYYRWRQIHVGLVFLMYAWCVLGLHWPTFVRKEMGMKDTILLEEFFILLPFLVGLLLSWDSFYRVEKALHQTNGLDGPRRFWPRFDYVMAQARQHLGLVLVPLTLFIGFQKSALWLWTLLAPKFWPRHMDQTIPHLSLSLAIGLMVLTAMPWLLTKIFLTTSLPNGPLRERLTAAARRMRFPFTDICLWHTRLGLANAMVTGFLPRPRYVLLSDLLLEQLEPDEVEAVFCHEIGHLHHRHIPLYLVFMAMSITVLTQGLQLGMKWLPSDVAQMLAGMELTAHASPSWKAWLFLGCGLGMVGGYVRLVFGSLSRSCERQADVFACKNLSICPPAVFTVVCTADGTQNGQVRVETPPLPKTTVPAGLTAGVPVFVSALEKVADLNGIPMEKPSWRHGSIAQRAEFLKCLAAQPAMEPRMQRLWFLGKAGLLLLLAVTVMTLWHLGANPFALVAE
jgi:STE24 endopeptidase